MKNFYIVLLVIILLFFAGCLGQQEDKGPDPNIEKANNLYLKSITKGKGLTEYIYSFEETANGYKNKIAAAVANGSRRLYLENAVFTKDVYFTTNGTIVCSRSLNSSNICVLAENDSAVQSHLSALSRKFFFDDQVIYADETNNLFFIEKGVIRFDPNLTIKQLDGVSCNQITYTIDYTNLTLFEASQYGISQGSPKIFDARACIADDGTVYERAFSYLFAGKKQETTWKLLQFETENVPEINLPANISKDSSAYELLSMESELQGRITSCYGMEKIVDQENCIKTFATEFAYPSLCAFAGSKSETCYLNIVSITKDPALCISISNQSIKDDCYVEVGGRTKNSTLCSSILDSTKKNYCLNVSLSVMPVSPVANMSNNTSETPEIVKELLEEG